MRALILFVWIIIISSYSLCETITYICPSTSKGNKLDPAKAIYEDLGIKPIKSTIFYGYGKAFVCLEVTSAEAVKLRAHKDVEVKTIPQVVLDCYDEIGKAGFNAASFAKQLSAESMVETIEVTP